MPCRVVHTMEGPGFFCSKGSAEAIRTREEIESAIVRATVIIDGARVQEPVRSEIHLRTLVGIDDRVLISEALLAARVRANGTDPWAPPPTLGTLMRLSRLNLEAQLREAGA